MLNSGADRARNGVPNAATRPQQERSKGLLTAVRAQQQWPQRERVDPQRHKCLQGVIAETEAKDDIRRTHSRQKCLRPVPGPAKTSEGRKQQAVSTQPEAWISPSAIRLPLLPLPFTWSPLPAAWW